MSSVVVICLIVIAACDIANAVYCFRSNAETIKRLDEDIQNWNLLAVKFQDLQSECGKMQEALAELEESIKGSEEEDDDL